MSSQRPRDPGPEAPYAGPLGATRREAAFVTTSEGAARRVELVRQVNALTDPLLARQALEGTLHRAGEHDLAVPFVYHDPTARRFALVVPAARAHEELTLRAELLARLASDPSESIPAYVRDARAVVGAGGLRRHLEEARPPLASDPRVEAQHRALEAREEKLHKRAQEITRREDELAAAQGELDARAQELDRQAAEVSAREEAVGAEELAMRANMAALGSREARLHAREEEVERRARPAAERVAAPHDPSEALTHRPPVVEEDDGGRHSREIVLEERLEVDLHDLAPAPADAARNDAAPPVTGEAPVAAALAVAPEERARWAARGDRPYVAVVEGEVRVWFQGTPEVSAQLAGATVVPVLQVDPDGALPHALLTLRGESGAPVYTRVALDVTRPEDRAVLESLARDFRVRAEVVSALGRALGATALGAPCEHNAARALEVLTQRPAGDADAAAAAIDRLRAHGLALADGLAPVPLGDEHALTSAAGVAAALAAVEPLLDRARLDRYVLAHGVSVSQVESFTKRLGLAALRCGVVPSGAFTRRALELGVAADERALAARALTAYARTCEGGVASIGRSPRDASRAWGPLLAWAAGLGVAPSDAVRAAIGGLYDPDDAESVHPPESRTAPGADAYGAMTDAELTAWIDHPDARLPAARELARRDASKHEAVIGRALRMLPAPRVAELAAELVRGGDALGDVWVELLSSRRRAVAAVAAVGAGVLKLRRALTPLVQRCLAKDNRDWRLAAWATGEFGAAAVRSLVRAEAPDPERLAWVLAHTIRCGAAKELERARAEAPAVFQDAATRALALQDEIRAWDEALRRGEGELEAIVHPVLARAAAS
jgi:hypothetical protein